MVLERQLDGQQLEILLVAAEEAKKKGLEITRYRASLYKTGTSFLIIFESSTTQDSQRGSIVGLPAFEVEIDEKLQLKRANFVR